MKIVKTAIISISLLLLYGTPALASYMWIGVAKEMGLSQGWLVSYNGEQLNYAGNPCSTRLPTNVEKEKLINSTCGSAETNYTTCQQQLSDWISTYPTCDSRNIGVRRLANGKIETFDKSQQTPEMSPITSGEQQNSQASSDNVINKDKWIPKIDYTKIAGALASLIFLVVLFYSIWALHKVAKIEKKIIALDEEWDKIPSSSKNPFMNNNTLMKHIAKKREPIERKLQLLKQDRQFILDKIPLIGLFRK